MKKQDKQTVNDKRPAGFVRKYLLLYCGLFLLLMVALVLRAVTSRDLLFAVLALVIFVAMGILTFMMYRQGKQKLGTACEKRVKRSILALIPVYIIFYILSRVLFNE